MPKPSQLIKDLRKATAPPKESELPNVIRYWVTRVAALNRYRITKAVREAGERQEFRTVRFPPARYIEGCLPLDFSADLPGDSGAALQAFLQASPQKAEALGLTVEGDARLTLTRPVTLTAKGRELVGGEFIHAYSFSLLCRMVTKELAKQLKKEMGRRPKFRIEVRRRPELPSCYIKSGKRFKNGAMDGCSPAVHIQYSVKF